jgi:hypothetical protein
VVDNVPLVVAQGRGCSVWNSIQLIIVFWLFLAYTTGTGGKRPESLAQLRVVAAMGMEKIDFFLVPEKKITLIALAGLFCGRTLLYAASTPCSIDSN